MQTNKLIGLVAAACVISVHAHAVVLFDQNVTPGVIFGSGNANGGFTVDQANSVELGLRAKVRFNDANSPENTFNSNGDGTYTFAAGLPPTGFGFAPGSTSTARWNFEWSINSNYDGGGVNLNQLTYSIQMDFDPGVGTNFFAFDPINQAFADHSIGNNGTTDATDTVAANPGQYAGLIANNNVAQNSWNMEFFDNAPLFPFDGREPGTYDFLLTASNASGLLASTQIQVIVTPEPASLAVLGLGLLGLGALRRRGLRR